MTKGKMRDKLESQSEPAHKTGSHPNPWLRFTVAALATWRITHLLANEDGPGEVIANAREKLGDTQLGQMMDCFQCTSIWIAAPFAFYAAKKSTDRLAAWLALSATACLLNEVTREEENRGDNDELLRQETSGTKKNLTSHPAPLPWTRNG
jgi:Protein of unknown function (DUF1360)